jgi:hypothetical protein
MIAVRRLKNTGCALVICVMASPASAQGEFARHAHRLAEMKVQEVATQQPERWPELAYILNKNVAPPFVALPNGKTLNIYATTRQKPARALSLSDPSALLAIQWSTYAALVFQHNRDGRIAYDIYNCRDTCEGHEAGFSWAEQHSVREYSYCANKSESFTEGCYVWVTRRKGLVLPPDGSSIHNWIQP